MIHFETINEAGRQLADTLNRETLSYEGEALVFIGALGICVRKILPLVHDKYTDPAVICIDSTGKYVIPVLSGHVGGANELARQIARVLGAEAVITTQSDNLGLWPLDTLARENHWEMGNIERNDMNHAIAVFVEKQPTALVLDWDDEGTRKLRQTCPEHVHIFSSYDEFQQHATTEFALLLLVSPHFYTAHDIPVIQYFPPCLHVGIGCQKMAPEGVAEEIVQNIIKSGYAPQSVASIGTITLKKDEPCLARLTTLLPQAELRIFPPEELAVIPVPNPSEKVFEVTSCYGVAEAAALASCPQGKFILEKQKGSILKDGVASHYTFALVVQKVVTSRGHIEIVGAGPGDPELVSVRGRRFLEQADLILYAGSLVPRELTLCAKKGAIIRSSADLDLEEQFLLMKDFYDRGKLVVRLHTGDPCIYGAIQEQMAFFDQYGMDYHITPGISSFLAAAAELRSQFTIPERCQTIILTRGEGRTPMPPKEKLQLLAAHQSTMCIFLSASIGEEVQRQLLEGGYPPETPVAACYKLTWKDQRIYRGQLKDLAQLLRGHHLTLTTMIVVGEAIDNRSGLSKLYDGHFTHLFRKGKS